MTIELEINNFIKRDMKNLFPNKLVSVPNYKSIDNMLTQLKLENIKEGTIHYLSSKGAKHYIYYSMNNEYWLVSLQKNGFIYLIIL